MRSLPFYLHQALLIMIFHKGIEWLPGKIDVGHLDVGNLKPPNWQI